MFSVTLNIVPFALTTTTMNDVVSYGIMRSVRERDAEMLEALLVTDTAARYKAARAYLDNLMVTMNRNDPRQLAQYAPIHDIIEKYKPAAKCRDDFTCTSFDIFDKKSRCTGYVVMDSRNFSFIDVHSRENKKKRYKAKKETAYEIPSDGVSVKYESAGFCVYPCVTDACRKKYKKKNRVLARVYYREEDVLVKNKNKKQDYRNDNNNSCVIIVIICRKIYVCCEEDTIGYSPVTMLDIVSMRLARAGINDHSRILDRFVGIYGIKHGVREICARGDLAILVNILEYDPGTVKDYCATRYPINTAIRFGHPEIVEFLIKSNLVFIEVEQYFLAAIHGNTRIFRIIQEDLPESKWGIPSDVCNNVAANGHYTMLVWIYAEGLGKCDENIIYNKNFYKFGQVVRYIINKLMEDDEFRELESDNLDSMIKTCAKSGCAKSFIYIEERMLVTASVFLSCMGKNINTYTAAQIILARFIELYKLPDQFKQLHDDRKLFFRFIVQCLKKNWISMIESAVNAYEIYFGYLDDHYDQYMTLIDFIEDDEICQESKTRLFDHFMRSDGFSKHESARVYMKAYNDWNAVDGVSTCPLFRFDPENMQYRYGDLFKRAKETYRCCVDGCGSAMVPLVPDLPRECVITEDGNYVHWKYSNLIITACNEKDTCHC